MPAGPSSAEGLPAVDVQRSTGQKGIGRRVQHALGDVRDLIDPEYGISMRSTGLPAAMSEM